jgi:hypothetical protein
MNITKRIQKLEQVKVNDFTLILLLDGDTKEVAYERYCTKNNKPRVVVFVSPFDMLL